MLRQYLIWSVTVTLWLPFWWQQQGTMLWLGWLAWEPWWLLLNNPIAAMRAAIELIIRGTFSEQILLSLMVELWLIHFMHFSIELLLCVSCSRSPMVYKAGMFWWILNSEFWKTIFPWWFFIMPLMATAASDCPKMIGGSKFTITHTQEIED